MDFHFLRKGYFGPLWGGRPLSQCIKHPNSNLKLQVGLASGANDNSSDAHFFATSPKPRWTISVSQISGMISLDYIVLQNSYTIFLYNILLEYRTRILYFNTIFLYNILKIVSIFLGQLAQADVKKTFLVRYFLLKCSCCGKFALWCWIYFCLHLDFWWKVLTKVVVFLLRVQFFQRNLLSIMFVWSSVKALCVMCIV